MLPPGAPCFAKSKRHTMPGRPLQPLRPLSVFHRRRSNFPFRPAPSSCSGHSSLRSSCSRSYALLCLHHAPDVSTTKRRIPTSFDGPTFRPLIPAFPAAALPPGPYLLPLGAVDRFQRMTMSYAAPQRVTSGAGILQLKRPLPTTLVSDFPSRHPRLTTYA